MLSASMKQWPGEHLVTDGAGGKAGPWVIDRAVREAKAVLAKRSTALPERHLWPDADESTRTAIGLVIAERMDSGKATADGMTL